jgi:hypothetical protein
LSRIFLNSLLHLLTCCTVIMPSPCISISWQWILMGENVLPIQTKFYYELLHRTKFPMLLPVHINISSESNLTVVPSIVCHPYCKCYFLPKNKMFTAGHHTYWTCLVLLVILVELLWGIFYIIFLFSLCNFMPGKHTLQQQVF